MNVAPLILQILALICLFLEALRLFQGPPTRPAWGWMGMFLWLASLMINAQVHATGGSP